LPAASMDEVTMLSRIGGMEVKTEGFDQIVAVPPTAMKTTILQTDMDYLSRQHRVTISREPSYRPCKGL
jgi:hypothetical protein